MTATDLTERVTSWTARRLAKRAPYVADNRFLQGPFAPVREERTECDLRVTGKIPEELTGVFARIGPNPIDVPNPGTYHWFVGDGMVHGLRLNGGRAEWYRNRYIRSESVSRKLGTVPIPGKRRGVTDAVNTNVISHAGKMWALVEAGALPVELSPQLESVRHSYFSSDACRSFSAHPHRDPKTGDLHAITYDGVVQNRIWYVRIDAAGNLARTVEIPVKHGPMMHDCALTDTKFVVLDLPVTLSTKAFLAGSQFPFRWNTAHASRVGLLPKDGEAGDMRWFDVEPCYVFHTANAYDDEHGRVILDAVVHDRMFDGPSDGPNSPTTTFERWIIDPARSDVQRTVISDARQEFPRYDERRSAQPYRYAYTMGTHFENEAAPLMRHDLATGAVALHEFGPGRAPGEPVFVGRSAGGAEDDGWIMTFVYDRAEDRSDFVILNAADLGGEPAAVIHLPVRVPLGFHGNWIAEP